MSDPHRDELTDQERRALAALSGTATPPPGLESRTVRQVMASRPADPRPGWRGWVGASWRPTLLAASLAVAFVGGTEVGRLRAEAGFQVVDAPGSDAPTLAETLILEDHERLDADAGPTRPVTSHRPPRVPATPATGPDDVRLWSDAPLKVGEPAGHLRHTVDAAARAEIDLMVEKGYLAEEPYSVPARASVATVVKVRPPSP